MPQTTPPALPEDLTERLVLIYQRVASSAVSLDYGLALAREIPTKSDFSANGLYPLANGVVGAARGGQTRAAAIQWRLVLEALDHALTARQHEAVAEAARAWLYIATYVLMQHPDGRVMGDARRRGEQLVSNLVAAGDQATAASILHDLGVLHSEPYIFGRDQRNFQAQTAQWLAQGRNAPIPLALTGSDDMPAAVAALGDAASMFERAAELRVGRARGASLKAFSDALLWRQVAGAPLDRKRLKAAMIEAWQLLDPEEDHVIAEMLAHNARALKITLPERSEPAAADAEELAELRCTDPQGYLHALTVAANHAATHRAALDHLLVGNQYAAETGDEAARVTFMLQVAAQSIKHFDLRNAAPAANAPATTWTEAFDRLALDASGAPRSPVDSALATIGLAAIASEASREDVAVPRLAIAMTWALDAASGLKEATATAWAQFSWYQASNFYKDGRFTDACAIYLLASSAAVRVDMRGLARQNFSRAIDAFQQVPDIAHPKIVAAAAQSLPRLQSDVPDLAGPIREFWLRVISHAAFITERLDDLPVALQAAKGASLVAARMAHRRRNVLTEPAVQTAIERWRQAAPGVLERPPAGYDEERLLAAHADSLEQPGSTPAEQLENLARALDRTIASQLAVDAPADAQTYLSVEDVRRLLPAGSVLVSIYPCFTDRGKAGFVTLLASTQGIVVRRARGSTPHVDFAVDGISVDDIGLLAAHLRTRLIDGAALPALAGDLERAYEYAFGAVEADLAALHGQGARHLCVNAHGALHFCPLALAGPPGRPMADDWIVTHLAAIGLLAPPADEAPGAARSGLGLFALSFDDARTGLPPLPNAADEARSIGQAVGEAPLLDREATVPRFEAALQTRRWVHVATHGQHDPASPALQSLYLHSGRRDVVPMRAFEVLRHRLDGLDLVTLSACETALGRYDVNDNSRGLQAFLFTAGVATVISCLWPVADAVAAAFFERLYAELADGRSKLEAFATAQKAVRDLHPDLVDWGAFQYSGAW